MKLLTPLVLTLAGLAALEGASAAQNAPVPHITSIPTRKAWAPGNLVVNGTNLGLAFAVELDGDPLPIIRATAARLIAGPLTARDPGFGAVEVISGRGVEMGSVEFLPTLAAIRRGLRLNVRLNNGEPGTYVLRYSYSPAGPAFDPGIYGPRHLPQFSNVLLAGVFPDADPVNLPLVMPLDLGFLGAPLRLQATCFAATSNMTAYTNLGQVKGFGNPMGP